MMKPPIPLFERLDVWQLSQRLASEIYDLTRSFPNEHAFGLVSQLRRAALSIPTNIAEGNESGSPREKIRFFLIAKRSAAEVRSLLRFARDRNILAAADFRKLDADYDRVGKMLYYLINSLRHQQW